MRSIFKSGGGFFFELKNMYPCHLQFIIPENNLVFAYYSGK